MLCHNAKLTRYIYGQSYRNTSGSSVMPVLSVSTHLDSEVLLPYPYFQIHTSDIPNYQSIDDSTTKQTNEEWLCRDRRMILFCQSSNLLPTRYQESSQQNDLHARLKIILTCDHTSYWRDCKGTLYLLVEPYRESLTARELNKLYEVGLVATELPAKLSPYCGVWNSRTGAQPATRSFLIADYLDRLRLQEIAKKLSKAAAVAPEWNDTSGIEHC
jgi:hypothetical protein